MSGALVSFESNSRFANCLNLIYHVMCLTAKQDACQQASVQFRTFFSFLWLKMALRVDIAREKVWLSVQNGLGARKCCVCDQNQEGHFLRHFAKQTSTSVECTSQNNPSSRDVNSLRRRRDRRRFNWQSASPFDVCAFQKYLGIWMTKKWYKFWILSHRCNKLHFRMESKGYWKCWALLEENPILKIWFEGYRIIFSTFWCISVASKNLMLLQIASMLLRF